MPDGPVELSGWVVDAFPLASAEVCTADGRSQALVVRESERIAEAFPVAGGDAAHEFWGRVQIGPGGIAGTPSGAPDTFVRDGSLAIVVTNSRGVRTVIDRRWW